MYPILFKIDQFTFYTHGFLAVLGIVLGSLIIYFFAKDRHLDRSLLFDNIIYAVLFGIIGARILYFMLYRNQFSSFSEIFYLWEGGMVSYGGFILGGLAYAVILKYQKQPILRWLDLSAIGFALGLSIGRLGNLMAGEYAGKPTVSRFQLGGVVPINAYEGLLVFFIFAGLLLLYLKFRRIREGAIFLLFLTLYGFGRFVIDFWRDEKVLFFHTSLGQLFSILIGLIGLILLIKTNFNLPLTRGKNAAKQ